MTLIATSIQIAGMPICCHKRFGYAFPLQVFEKYPIRMKPKIEFTEENDEGFRKREWFYNQSKRRGAKVF